MKRVLLIGGGGTLGGYTATELLKLGYDVDVVAFESRKFVPHVHKVMPIAEVSEAHAILERGENRGKVVLMVEN